MKTIIRVLALAALAFLLAPAQAESQFVAGDTSQMTATARLDFNVTIPRVLYLRVGAGTDFASNASVNLIDFTVPAASVGNGTAVAASAASGDLSNGAVTVRVMGNGGDITLNSSTVGALTTGTAGQTIGWNRINVASAALAATTTGFSNGAIPHPSFNATGGNGTAVTLNATNKLVQQEGKWTYSYANADVVAAGVYGGVNVNNGRVSYTATMP